MVNYISRLEILSENNACTKHYMDNKCDPSTRVPAMQNQCIEWEKCLQRDPLAVARLKYFHN